MRRSGAGSWRRRRRSSHQLVESPKRGRFCPPGRSPEAFRERGSGLPHARRVRRPRRPVDSTARSARISVAVYKPARRARGERAKVVQVPASLAEKRSSGARSAPAWFCEHAKPPLPKSQNVLRKRKTPGVRPRPPAREDVREGRSVRSPAVPAGSPEIRAPSSDVRARRPAVSAQCPGVPERSPVFQAQTPGFRGRSTEFQARTPEFRRRSTEFQARAPEFRRRSTEFQASLEVGSLLSEPRR